MSQFSVLRGRSLSSPAEAVARCAQFWLTIGIKRESTTMSERFAGLGWSGTEVTVMPGQATASRRHFDDSFLELGEIAPGLVLGGIAVYTDVEGGTGTAAPPQQDAHRHRGAPLARRRSDIH